LREKGFAVRPQNAITVVNGMRGFEKKRLMDSAPYEAVSKRVVPDGVVMLTEEQLNERPEEGQVREDEEETEETD
jgi:hypothetical protein